MTTQQRLRHDLIWLNMTSKIKQTLTDARLTYLQQEVTIKGTIFTKHIKK